MLAAQRNLRSEVVAHCDRTRVLEEATISLSLRRSRRARQPRELREAERSRHKRMAELEMGKRSRRNDFMNALAAHTDEFKTFHKEARKTAKKTGQAVLLSFELQAKEKRENTRTQQAPAAAGQQRRST